MKNKLWNTLENYQTTNIVEKGVKFTEDGFNELCQEILDYSNQNLKDIKIATGKGALIGAASVGLVWAGVAGYKKFRNRKPKVNRKKIKKVLENEIAVTVSEPEVLEVSEDGPPVKKVSGRDKEALAAVVAELKENEKKKQTTRKK